MSSSPKIPQQQTPSAIDTQTVIGHFEHNGFTIFIHEEMEPIADLWLHLQDECPSTIYQNYFWQKTWFETIGKAEGSSLFLITGFLNDAPVFLIPLIIKGGKAFKTVTWLGGDHANYRFGLFLPSQHGAIVNALPQIIQKTTKLQSASVDLFHLPQQPMQWDEQENPMAAAFSHIANPNSGGSIAMNGDFEEILSLGNAKRKRKNLRSQERALQKLGGYQSLRTNSPEERDTLFNTFIAQKKEWFAKRGIKNKFDDEATAAFFHKLARVKHSPGQDEHLLEFDYILADDQILALQAAGTCKGQHFGYFTSMHNDPKYAAISPGSLVFYKSIETACKKGLRRFDFGVGADRYKKSWCNETHILVDVSIPISANGYAIHFLLKAKTKLKASIKKNQKLWTLVKKAREKLS